MTLAGPRARAARSGRGTTTGTRACQAWRRSWRPGGAFRHPSLWLARDGTLLQQETPEMLKQENLGQHAKPTLVQLGQAAVAVRQATRRVSRGGTPS